MSPPELVLPAPAKLNLFLHVTGRRADGYHQVQTVFQLLDFGDEVTLRLRDDGVVRLLKSVPGTADEANLALRAALMLKASTDGDWGVDIGIEKRIPSGAGLGGASSDAATVLLGIDWLARLGAGAGKLAEIGLGLGADVPLFVLGRTAWAEGVGEMLTPLPIGECWYLVIFPGVAVSTAEVFRDPGLTRDTLPVTISGFLAADQQDFHNDLLPVATRLAPAIDEALTWLAEFAPARMSGSGSSVFAAFSRKDQADAVLAQTPGRWQSWVARGVRESPLHRALRRLSEGNPATD